MFRSGGLDVSATCITYHIGSAYRCTLAIATGVCVRAVVVAIAANLVATDLGVRIILISGDVSVSREGYFGHMYYLPYSDMDEPSRSSIVRIIPHPYNSFKASSDFTGKCLAFVYIGNIFYMQHRSTIEMHSMLLGLFMEVELTMITQIIT